MTVTEDVVEENFVASGKMTIVNHNAEDAMTVALSDVLNGTTATITACTGDADLSDGLTIVAGGTSVCDYTAALTYDDVTKAPTNNTNEANITNARVETADDRRAIGTFEPQIRDLNRLKKVSKALKR